MPENIKPINSQNVSPIAQGASTASGIAKKQAVSFQEILQAKIAPSIKFSAHALERLQKRNVVLSQENMNKLLDAVNKAQAKGCRESLVLMDDLALIVSVKNRTVITAIDGERLKENIFTNIDSAIIV